MKSYSDDIPNAEELKRNTAITESTNDLLKDNLSKIIEHEEAMDERIEQLNRDTTRNTVLLTAIGMGVAGTLILQLFANNMG